MTKIEIGTLEQFPVRSVWPKEAGDFTPWLAENVELIGQALGMELDPHPGTLNPPHTPRIRAGSRKLTCAAQGTPVGR